MNEKELIERLKEVFVTRRECDEKNEIIKTAMSKIEVRLAVIEDNITKQNSLTKMVLGGIITIIIGAVASMILKG